MEIVTEYPSIICKMEENSDVIFVEIKNNSKIDLEAAKQIVVSRLLFTKDKKHYMIVDVSSVREISSEAKEFLQQQDGGLKNILGAAFIATNPISTLIANIFIKTQTDFQARYFANMEDALEWITKYKEKQEKILRQQN